MSTKSCGVNTTALHTIGRTQSCGYCLALQEDAECSSGLRISSLSDNIAQAPWIRSSTNSRTLVGKDLGHVFHADCVETVRSLVIRQTQVDSTRHDRVCSNVNRNTADICPFQKVHAELHLPSANQKKEMSEVWTCSVARSNPGVYLLEVEPKICAERESCLLKVAYLLSGIPLGAAPQVIAAALGNAIGENLPAYDRVMVYRFGEDNAGDVIHESIRPGFETDTSYLNLRFPAADIPPAARELLKLNGVRFIADTSDPGVPVILDERASTPLDLSRSAFRTSSACHLRYLQNMGVKASLVVAIIVDGELWGLCSCHSYTKTLHPSCEERLIAGMAAAIAAPLISYRQREDVATTALSLSNTLSKIKGHTRVYDFLSAEHETLRSILGVDTIVLCERSRHITVYGNEEVSLTMEDCQKLLERKSGVDSSLMFHDIGGKGMAYFSVRSSLVAFLRGTVASHVNWAGKPDPPVHGDDDMHPRASFDSYMLKAVAKSEPWSLATVDLLGMLSLTLLSHMYGEALPADLQETFAHLSHELRTPFHGVVGCLEILETEHGTIDSAEEINVIRTALHCGKSMLSTLNNVLVLAKDRSHAQAILSQDRFVPSSPVLLAMEVLKLFATTESVEVIGDVGHPAGAVEVLGDEGRIDIIVQSLVNNAIKFTPSGGKVQVSLLVFDSLEDATKWWAEESSRFDAAGSLVRAKDNDSASISSLQHSAKKWYTYVVEDSGVGVLSSDLSRVGAAYKQMSHGKRKSFAGTGLSLKISKAYVDAMSGRLWIASTLSEEGKHGSGTLFAAVLSLSTAGTNLGRQNDVVEGGASTAAQEGAIETIGRMSLGARKLAFLVADDLNVNVKLLQRKIEKIFSGGEGDVQVLTASDGLLALETQTAVRTNTGGDERVLAGIFVDLRMPNVDGVECTKRVRELEVENHWPRVMIFGCTADTSENARNTFADAGGDGLIGKPWQPGQVEGACNAMLTTVFGSEKSWVA